MERFGSAEVLVSTGTEGRQEMKAAISRNQYEILYAMFLFSYRAHRE
jgi:hypothetical protein